MINICKAMFYRIIKSRVTLYCFILSIAFPFLLVLSSTTSATYVDIKSILDSVNLMGLAVIFVFISIFICNDYRSKTLYYEVMNGHHRYQVYTGRALVVILFGFIMFNIQLIITLVMSNLTINYQLTSQGNGIAVLKIIAVELCVLGFLMFFAFTALALKNIIISFSVSWFGLICSNIVVIFDEYEITSTGTTISSVLGSGAIKYALAGDFSNIWFTICIMVSIVLILFFYFMGLFIFKKSELH